MMTFLSIMKCKWHICVSSFNTSPLRQNIALRKENMAVTLVKVAGKLTIGGFALYGLSEVLSSQDNAIKHISFLNSKTRENIPVNLPEVSFIGDKSQHTLAGD